MKDLINAIVEFLTAVKGTSELSAVTVKKGFSSDELDNIAIERYPFVEVDDGGESVNPDIAGETQERIYRVVFFMAVLTGKEEKALDDILDLSNQVKTLIETEANRQLDGHTWGIDIQPVNGKLIDDGTFYFFRGREVVVEFKELEDNYGPF